MANEDYRKPEDSQFEQISVASLGTLGGAALFFKTGNGPQIDRFTQKAKTYLTEYSRVIQDHSEDLSEINLDMFSKAGEIASRKYDSLKNYSTAFHPYNTNAIESLRKFYKLNLNKDKELRTYYYSEAQKVAINALDKTKLPENVRSAILSNLNPLSRVGEDPEKFYQNLTKRLDVELIGYYNNEIDDVVNAVKNWTKENDFESNWLQTNGQKYFDFLKEKIFDVESLYEEQEKRKRSLTGRLTKSINPDKNITFGDIMDIMESGDPEKIKQLNNFLGKDNFLSLGSKELDSILPSDQANKFKEAFNVKINSGSIKDPNATYSFTVLDFLSIKGSQLKNDNPELYEKFRKLEITGLHKNSLNEIYSTATTQKYSGEIFDFLTNIFPFSMSRGQDIRNAQKSQPIEYFFKSGELHPELAKILGSKNDFLNKSVRYINKRWYSIEDDGSFKEIKSLRGSSLVSAETGALKETVRSQNMGEARIPDEEKGFLERLFGFEMSLEKAEEKYGNNTKYFANFDEQNIKELSSIIRYANSASTPEELILAQYGIRELTSGAEKFESFVEKNIYGFDTDTVKRLQASLDPKADSEAYNILDTILRLGDEEQAEDVLNELAKVGRADLIYKNPRIPRALRRYNADSKIISRSYSLVKSDPLRSGGGQYISRTFIEELQDELSKEFLFIYEQSNNGSYKAVDELLNKVLTGKKRRQAKELNVGRKYLSILGFPGEGKRPTNDDENISIKIAEIFNNMSNFAQEDSEDSKIIKKQIGEFVAANEEDFDKFKISIKNQIAYNPSKMIIIKNPMSSIQEDVMSIIKDINKGYLDKAAKSTGSLAKNIGLETVNNRVVNFLLGRVNNDFKIDFRIPFTQRYLNLDLSIKGEDSRTTAGLLKNWGLKRIVPFFGAIYLYNFLDDMSKASTNMGLGEAALSGTANAYLGVKKVTGAIGLDSIFKGISKDNTLFNYLGEYTGGISGEWNTYEEQRKYYEEGYTPIRKSRFWWFGSSNEFRGGRISYFEPNSLRTLASNYKDMSLYNGSYWNKYNPLNILDPYYLEDLHTEDRPYPISGSFFEENTPWGVVLNPTLGAIIKPKRYLHSDRLDDSGVDVKAIIASINNQIRENAIENDNLLFVKNGRLSSMDFMAYNAPTYSSRILSIDNSFDEDSSTISNDYGLYNTPVYLNNDLYQNLINNNQIFIKQNQEFSLKDRIAIEAAKGNQFAQIANIMTGSQSSLNIIKAENEKLMAQAGYQKSQGIMIESKLNSQMSAIDKMLEDSEQIAELMNVGSGNDYIHEMTVSARMITGLYGWGVSNTLDIGQNNNNRIATSANMYSNSRAFWDMNLGGLDFDLLAGSTGGKGSITEIMRRFIPEYRRFQTKNPLMNTMPDWLPERFKFGDPYSLVPVGESRLPGIGYESLNELHPDIYGAYGAFDRFKILADIAPYSPEYKFWKNIASKTIQDPKLKQKMADIRERVSLQNKQHNFQEYKYVGRDVDRKKAIITEIGQNGTFKIYGSDATYKLAGATINANENEARADVLSRYISPGQSATIVIDTNEAYARNKDKDNTINAALVINGESVAEAMIQNGDAKIRKGDMSAAAIDARHNSIVNGINWMTELLMHADLPIIHNRWLRVNTALEDYQDDMLYGTSFQTWDDILQTFIIPNMRKSANSTFWTTTGIVSDIIRNNVSGDTKNNLIADLAEKYIKADGPLGKYKDITKLASTKSKINWVNKIQYMSDRGALMGYLTGKFTKLGRSENATLARTKFRRAGVGINLAFSAIAAPENLAVGMMSWSRLGYIIANEHFGGSKYRLAAAGAGALIGLARWAGTKKALSDDPYKNIYIPDSVRERWELQDYFDRLTYLKYTALYEKAADKALDEEGVDIRAILNKQLEEQENIKDTKDIIKDALSELDGKQNPNAVKMRQLLTDRFRNLKSTAIPLSGGEYTKSAIMYYNAARATMYAMDRNSSMTDIIRALPKMEREYFMEFVKERDDEKREEILSQVSPHLRRALKHFWYAENEEIESNESFFEKHALPAPTWSGWNPQVDLSNVQAKVIKNEALNYSDFGVYASQYRDESVINAPELDYNTSDSLLASTLKIQTILSGLGLTGVEVRVEPSSDSRLQVLANIMRVVEYKVGEDIENIFEGI